MKNSEKDGEYEFKWFGTNRLICDVLEDMRRCYKTSNFGPMKGLIEEAQVLGNRMEAALGNQKDLIKLEKETSKARKAYKELKREYRALQSKIKAKKSPKSKKKA